MNLMILALMLLTASGGCASSEKRESPAYVAQVIAVAVAPVLNLSDSRDWDPQKVTDVLASELASVPGVSVVPVNRVLAALAEKRTDAIRTPEEALELAAELGADAMVVAAITEYQPYDPPIVGMLIQMYSTERAAGWSGLDPSAASREATDFAAASHATAAGNHPVQIQRVFNASSAAVLDEVKEYARERAGRESPYGYRVHLKSQQNFIRYCCWSSIRSMLWARAHCGTDAGLGENGE